jgi:parallel beta-helix repeat protein
MKKITLFTFLVAATTLSFATNYYVNPTGSNAKNGLTTANAFQTINYAATKTAAGDTVFIMNGTYTNTYQGVNVADVYISGTAANRIVFTNFAGHKPLIKLGGNNWGGIAIQGADYIVIDGITIIGNNDAITLQYAQAQKTNTNNPATSANGIGITKEYGNAANFPHHNTIRNCTISKCGGGGIYTYNADYTTIENNTVSECGWYSPYGNSGISMYQSWNSDASTGIKNFIVGNTCYRNEEYIPFFVQGIITDGNGIIIDDFRNTQNNSTLGNYMAQTYIANNLVFDNGGRGIHVYSSDKVIIVNNTCYRNCQSPTLKDGEFTAYDADKITFINNIALPSSGVPPMDRSPTSTSNITVDHNLWAANSNLANPFGTNTGVGAPNFIAPAINPISANFRLLTTSAAKNAGTRLYAPTTDKDGIARSLTDSVDIGCYEFRTPTSLADIEKIQNTLFLFPNPASTIISFKIAIDRPLNITIYDNLGRKMHANQVVYSNEKATLDVSHLENGVYFIKVLNKNKVIEMGRFLKTK